LRVSKGLIADRYYLGSMSEQLPDVQATRPDVAVGLNRVGVSEVKKRVRIARNGQPVELMAEFEAYVDLPGWRKGADMSRNMQVIDEIIESAVADEAYRLEDICGEAAERLLGKHEYTTQAEVRMTADLVVDDSTPATDLPTQGTAAVTASATATDDGTRESIGATVTGMTVCPCSQGMSEARARDRLYELGVEDDTVEAFLDTVPQPGHSQRGHATIEIESEGAPPVDLVELIDVARDAMSARIYNLAKRPDEDEMTYRSHANARFVEDCVRAMAEGVVEQFPDLPDEAVVEMRQENDESIHQHDAIAQRRVRVETLREEV
jgi:GTP cyclohydrolase-4